MRPNADPPRDLTDRMIRQALSHPANLRSFLQQAVPGLADGFDCERLHLLDREFPMDDWRTREADLPFEIPYRLGPTEVRSLVYVLIEHQSAEDPVMPLRMLHFVVHYWERQWRTWHTRPAPSPPLQLSPVLPLVLYTGVGPWQNNRTLHDMLGEPAEFHGFVPDWGPLFWELSEQNAEQLLESGDGWQQMLAVMRAQGEEAPAFERLYDAAMHRLAALANDDKVRWSDLMRMVLSLATFRRPRSERERLVRLAEEAQANLDRQKEIKIMSQTFAESIWEEAWTKGEAKGALSTMRRILKQFMEKRFGPLPEATIHEIERCDDIERLNVAVEGVLALEKLDDFHL
jgi:hypothetical protein